jgi:predicted DCC family thiol-disulfide oxidoreductase YuxK
MLMFAAALGTNLPVRFGKLPVIRKLMRRSYGWVARNRRRFPGDMPWCQQHPEDCQPDESGGATA